MKSTATSRRFYFAVSPDSIIKPGSFIKCGSSLATTKSSSLTTTAPGKSSKAVQKYSIKMFTDDAAAILNHLDAEQAIVCGHSMGGVVAQLLALEHPNKVKKLILASSGSSHPGAKGIPLAMCRDMVRMGFEGYIRQHTIETGWTKEFVAAHPDLIEKFLQVRMSRHRPAGELSSLCAGAPRT